MLKYTTTQVTFREIPDEITLCINISNCPIHCPDCHSKELWKDIGKELNSNILIDLMHSNPGISCVCFLGGDSDYESLRDLVSAVICYNMDNDRHIKTAIYSGRKSLQELVELTGPWIDSVEYIKVGPFIKDRGGLDNPNTNQRLYMMTPISSQMLAYADNTRYTGYDITYKFRNNEKTR